MGASDGTDYFDASEYELRASFEDEHYWHVHRRRVLFEALSAYAPPGDNQDRILEIGCGIGTVATHLNGRGYTIDYADIYESAIAIARERATQKLGAAVAEERRFFRIDATEPLAAQLPYTKYRGVLMLDVIEHLPDDQLVLSNVRRALGDGKVPGAFVLITVPAFDFLWSSWDGVEKHKRRYTRGQLEDVLSRTGFDVVRSTYFFTPLFFAALGVKGLRTLRDAVVPARPPAQHIRELLEANPSPLVNRIVLGVHAAERRWLHGARTRPRGLPFGTSILAFARVRP